MSLLPETAPVQGKQAIAKFMDDVVARMPGYQIRKIEIDFQRIETSGKWASEWAYEHQIVDAPEGKSPFEWEKHYWCYIAERTAIGGLRGGCGIRD